MSVKAFCLHKHDHICYSLCRKHRHNECEFRKSKFTSTSPGTRGLRTIAVSIQHLCSRTTSEARSMAMRFFMEKCPASELGTWPGCCSGTGLGTPPVRSPHTSWERVTHSHQLLSHLFSPEWLINFPPKHSASKNTCSLKAKCFMEISLWRGKKNHKACQ